MVKWKAYVKCGEIKQDKLGLEEMGFKNREWRAYASKEFQRTAAGLRKDLLKIAEQWEWIKSQDKNGCFED